MAKKETKPEPEKKRTQMEVDEETVKAGMASEKPNVIQRRAMENELRRYVRRVGGFRKNLPDDKKKRAKELMAKLGRTEPEWDLDLVPYMGNAFQYPESYNPNKPLSTRPKV